MLSQVNYEHHNSHGNTHKTTSITHILGSHITECNLNQIKHSSQIMSSPKWVPDTRPAHGQLIKIFRYMEHYKWYFVFHTERVGNLRFPPLSSVSPSSFADFCQYACITFPPQEHHVHVCPLPCHLENHDSIWNPEPSASEVPQCYDGIISHIG